MGQPGAVQSGGPFFRYSSHRQRLGINVELWLKKVRGSFKNDRPVGVGPAPWYGARVAI